MRISTALLGMDDPAGRVRRLADLGIDGAFTFEGPHDVFVPLVLAAPGTPIDLLTNVAIAFPRNPVHLAHTANDLQLLSGGRFTLGLGTQIRTQVERRFGVPFDRPVARMRELVEALRAIFRCWGEGERLDVRGEFYRHTLMTPMFNPGPNPHGPPPIHLGALGPQMVRLAAEVADGILVMPFNSARHFQERTLPAIAEGLARGGRSPADLEVVPEVIVCAGRDERELAEAEAGTRLLLGFYGSTPAYRPVLEAHGWGDLQPELRRLSKEGRWDEMGLAIDDEVLRTIAAVGSPAEVGAEILDRFGAHADHVALYAGTLLADETLGELVDAVRAGGVRSAPGRSGPADSPPA